MTDNFGAMSINIKTINDISIVDLGDKIDIYNTSVFKDAINKLIAGNKILIILNLEKVAYIDSSGLGVLISTMAELKKIEGSLKIIGLTDFVKNTFKIMQTTPIFEIYETEADAVKSFKK